MYWVPFAVFILAGVIMAAAQGSYFSDLSRRGHEVTPDSVVAQQLRDHPRSLPGTVVTETARRLRALVTHQTDPQAERRRVLACISVVFVIASFVWVALSGSITR